MKIRILILTAFLCVRAALADEISGIITTSEQVSPGYTQLGNAYWYASSASYVNGGVTFTFPDDLFLQNPTVIVSLSSSTYSSSSVSTALVTTISTTSVTVRVNVSTLVSIGEASSNSMVVQIFAIGTAN